MSFKFTFREITPEDTEILRILKLRNAKPEEHICCEILRGDGITMKTWYSKADVALWGEDYIKANSKMKYIDGDWTVSLDVEPWKRTHGVSSKKVTSPSSPRYPTWLTGHVKEWAEKRLPTVTLCSTTGNELLEVWYYGDLLTVKGEPQSYIVDGSPAPGLVAARDPESDEEFVIFDGGRHGYDNMLHYRCYPEGWIYERLGPDGMIALIFWGDYSYGTYDTRFMFERYVELDERWLFDLAKDPEGRKPTVTWQTYNRGGVLYGSYDEMFISLLPRKVENPELKRILRDYFRIRSEKVKVEESITVYKDATERFGD